nr:Imm61 family immunity protein [Mycolicibacterium sphagni]
MARCDLDNSGGNTVLRSHDRNRGEYRICRRTGDRVGVVEVDVDDVAQEVLFAADMTVVERFLIGVLGDDIRDDLELPYLQLPFQPEDLAPGFELSEMAGGYRTLRRTNGGPVAASRDEIMSLVRLVPLSQFLTLTVAELRASILDSEGAPLVDCGRYRHRP